MNDIQEERPLDRFRAEYERLHRAIQKQHGSILDLLICALGVIASALLCFTFMQNTIVSLKIFQELEKFHLINELLNAEIEKRLHKKAKDLSNDVAKNKKKMNAAMKINEEDQSTIASLKAEIDKNWMVVDESQEKEAEAKEKIKYLAISILFFLTPSQIFCTSL